MNVGTVRMKEGLSFPTSFSRACISVAVDVVGIRLGVGAVGAGCWFCKRVVISSISCFCMVMNC